MDFGLERAGALREFARQTREHLAIDGDPAPLHAREHRNERPLQRLVNAAHALGGNARLEHLPQPQRDVGALSGILAGLLDLHAIEREPGFARAGELVLVDRSVTEVALRQRSERVIGAPGIEHVGQQHDVVMRGELDPAQRKHLHGELEVAADFEHLRVFEQRF